MTNLARHNQKLAAQLADRRVQDALERLGGRIAWNTLEPFDRRLSFGELTDQMRLEPDMVRAELDGGLIVDVAFRRPGGCRVSVVNESGRSSWSKSDTLYERSVADGAELDSAIREAGALLLGRAGAPADGGRTSATPARPPPEPGWHTVRPDAAST